MRFGAVLVVFMLVAACGEVKPGNRCSTASDCSDPAAPYCVASQCEAACKLSTDCTDPMHAVCASDGACVGCAAATDCTAAAPVCDTTARSCRGCSSDLECSGGVCVEADGVCVADANVAFVAQMGNDSGTCTRAAPCATLPFAITQAGTRNVIHVLGGTLQVANVSFTVDRILDGEDTTLEAGNATAITVKAPANLTIEGFRIAAPPFPPAGGMPPPAISVASLAHGRLYGMQITGEGSIPVATAGGEVAILHSHIGSLTQSSANTISCGDGKLLIDQSLLEMTIAGEFGPCHLTVTRTRFESLRDGSVHVTGGQLIMENNLVIHRDGFNDSISVSNLTAGSAIRFNTIVNTTATPSDGSALGCDNSIVATSNVFAYNSGHPITGTGCQTRYSVFDDQSMTATGTGNHTAGIDTLFVNRAAGDYHLSASSVARGAAEPGLTTMVTGDFDGNPRPAPAGSNADSGAFEAK
jgi:hypothetical protein